MVAAIPYEGYGIGGIAVDSGKLYFTRNGGPGARFAAALALDGSPSEWKVPIRDSGTGLEVIDGELFLLDHWPGRISRIQPDGGLQIVIRLPCRWPRDLALDGETLWFLECSDMENRYGLCALDLTTQEVAVRLSAKVQKLGGVAFGKGRLWVSTRTGTVHEIDPQRARKEEALESGIVRSFPGTYEKLAFDGDDLWGLDQEMNRVCRIRVHP